MCQILLFRHKKHLFDYERELEQLLFIEKVFFMYNFFEFHLYNRWATVSVASSLNCLKALITCRYSKLKAA